MNGETLYEIAHEMLSQSNVFQKDVSEIKYTNTLRDEVSLLDCVKQETLRHNHRFRGKSDKNLQLAYDSITGAMISYLESYSAPFSFKQQTKRNFKTWLEKMGQIYSVLDAHVPDELEISKAELDTGVTMLKLLHARDGVTYADLQKGLGGITPRAIQKALVKISPSLYSGPAYPYTPFRLGGQPLCAEISLESEDISADKKRFRTLNSVHPLVLQENVMQLATLLKALSYRYYQCEDDISRTIAVDIWSQMSEYAQQKIINYFAFDDIDLEDFIVLLNNTCPDDHANAYHTEREMLQLDKIEMPVDQALSFLMKAPGRTGIVILESAERIIVDCVSPVVLSDGTKAYEITDSIGNTRRVKKTEIKDVLINE